jgi:plasmid maintenance system killer protein
LHIEFESEKVKKCFFDMDRLSKQIGKERAKTMKKRIDQLKASVNFAQYLLTGLGKPHLLEGNLKGYYGISITGNIRLVLRPDAENIEPEALISCDTVIIKGAVDYHGGKNEWIIP